MQRNDNPIFSSLFVSDSFSGLISKMLSQNGAKFGFSKITTFVNQVKRPRISNINSKRKCGVSLYDQENPFVLPL